MNLTYMLQKRLPYEGQEVCRRVRILTGFACNFKCSFCYYHDILHDFSKGFRPVAEIKSEMRRLSSLGMTSFDFSGGEPTLHPDFIDLVSYGYDLGSSISCVTNGFKLANFDFCKKCFDSGLSEVLISIHGIKEDHDRITGKNGAFDKAIGCAKNCARLGMKVRINCTLEYKNYTNLPRYLDNLEQLGISQLNFIILNYNDYAKDFAPIPVQEICCSLNSLDLSKYNFEINVRYVPYCLINNPRLKVLNYYDHIFDVTDWAPLYSYYECKEKLTDNKIVEQTIKYFEKTLPEKYYKPQMCLKCKMYSRCDGLKNNDRGSTNLLIPFL